MCRPRWLALFLPLALVAPAAHGERHNITVYTNQDGLPQRQVLAIARDEVGYLWVGTYGGLSAFNGRRFTTLRTRDGLSSNSIMDVVRAPHGRLWVGTSGGGVCLLQRAGTVRCFRAGEHLPSDDVLDLEDDGDGGVWVGTYDGVTHLTATGSPRSFRFAGTKPLRNVWSVKRELEKIWLACDAGIAEVRDDGVHLLPVQIPGGRVRAISHVPPWLFIGGERGLYRIAFPSLAERLETVLAGVSVQDMVRAGATLWVATRSGLLRWDSGRLSRLTAEHGLPSDVVHRVVVDREGTVWAGCEAGLVKLRSGPFVTFTRADGLPHDFVRAVAAGSDGALWVGTRGGLAVSAGEKFQEVARNRLPGQRVYDILPVPNGEVWVATNGGAVHLRAGRLVRQLTRDNGLPDSSVYALAFSLGSGELFLGTWSGTACLKGGALVPLPAELATARPLCLHVDQRGRLWVGLRDGKVLVRESDGSLKTLGAKEGLSDQVVWSIASDTHGVWLATNGDGAFHITDQGVRRFNRSHGLADDFVWQVLLDHLGRVWLFTSQGLDRLEAGKIRHFGIHDGLPDLEGSANACAVDASGTVWFGTSSGLARFDPSAEESDAAPPPVLLERATVGEGTPLQPYHRLPPNPGSVSFSLMSLSFRNEKATRYSYRLLPVQPSWSTPQASGEVTFVGLGAQRYRFEGVAVDADGRRSPTPVSFTFTVAAPWWRRSTTAVGMVLLALLATLGYGRWRVSRLQSRATELEELIRQRTRQLEEKAKELAQLAETDELTGLPNRRSFFRKLREELQHLWRAPKDARLCLLLLDLDGFKEINDTLGHNAGDAVLQAVAAALRGAMRTTDTVARFGGDEFAVILPMTDRTGATVAAAKILTAVKAAAVDFGGVTLRVAASIGLAVVAPSAAFAEEEVTRLIQRADLALYAAKRRGGDSVLDDQETWA